MRRLLALDVGTKRIGIAVSDPLGIFSTGLKTIKRLPEANSIKEICNLINEYKVNKIIIGLPINMNGTQGSQSDDTRSFASTLRQAIQVDIEFIDERLTSVLAEKILIAQNISPSRNRELIDKKAAELILQQYLDTCKNRTEVKNNEE